MVQRFQKIEKVQVSKLQGRGREEAERRLHCRTQMGGPQKAQGLQTASPSEPRPASPNLVNSASFPTSPSIHTSQPPDVRLSSYFLKRALFLTLPYSYQYTECSSRMWHSGQSPEETLSVARYSQGSALPKVQKSSLPTLLSPLHSHPEDLAQSPTQGKHPPSLYLQAFIGDQCPSSYPKATSHPSPRELSSPKKGMRLDLRPAARGVLGKGEEADLVTPDPFTLMALSL